MGVVSNVIKSSMDAMSQKTLYASTVNKAKAGWGSLGNNAPGAKSLKMAQDDVARSLDGLTPEQAAQMRKAGSSPELQALQNMEKVRADEVTSGMKQIGGAAKDWLTGADAVAAGNSRIAALGKRYGALGGAAVGARYMSGGSMMYNNRGERDIAGIPMI